MSNGCHASVAAGLFSTRTTLYLYGRFMVSGFPTHLDNYCLLFESSSSVQFALL